MLLYCTKYIPKYIQPIDCTISSFLLHKPSMWLMSRSENQTKNQYHCANCPFPLVDNRHWSEEYTMSTLKQTKTL